MELQTVSNTPNWMLFLNELWITIFFYFDLKELTRLQIVCKLFHSLLSKREFIINWSKIYLKVKEIPPFQNTADAYLALHHRYCLFKGISHRKKKLEKIGNSPFALIQIVSTHAFEPYCAVKGIGDDILLYRREKFVCTIVKSAFKAFDCFWCDIPGYIIVAYSQTENMLNMIAFPLNNSNKKKYFTIPIHKNNHLISISISEKKILVSECCYSNLDFSKHQKMIYFYSFGFCGFSEKLNNDSFSFETYEIPFKLSLPLYPWNDSYPHRERIHNWYFHAKSINQEEVTTIMRNDWGTTRFFSNGKNSFLLGESFIYCLETKEKKKFSLSEFFDYANHAYFNEEENTIVLTNDIMFCMETSKWNEPKNKETIPILWFISLENVNASKSLLSKCIMHDVIVLATNDKISFLEEKKILQRKDVEINSYGEELIGEGRFIVSLYSILSWEENLESGENIYTFCF